MRRMLAFIGAPFDRRCLAFHENRRYARTASYAQVTEKLYDRSRYRYRAYRDAARAGRPDPGADDRAAGLRDRLAGAAGRHHHVVHVGVGREPPAAGERAVGHAERALDRDRRVRQVRAHLVGRDEPVPIVGLRRAASAAGTPRRSWPAPGPSASGSRWRRSSGRPARSGGRSRAGTGRGRPRARPPPC